ncbi:hypothetical protein KC19_6G092900 [Ceratodon purpureus]|uniref:Uncharacterized protein n=1 Tax=Ceratodon purpureus TaxID=3225 RepID=A0A8T0HDU4_CERPU|nr:hypothetical protein KC19_6G092900 [Ceratodon purpureus]
MSASVLLMSATSSELSRRPDTPKSTRKATLHNSRLNPSDETYCDAFVIVIAAWIQASLQQPSTKLSICFPKATKSLKISASPVLSSDENLSSALPINTSKNELPL